MKRIAKVDFPDSDSARRDALLLCLALWLGFNEGSSAQQEMGAANNEVPYSSLAPQVIRLDVPAEDEGIGGLIASDVNGDRKLDFIVTKPGRIAVHDHSGKRLWTERVDIQITAKSEANGLPGWHAPGVQSADVDGDRNAEVLFLTKDGNLQIRDGATGVPKASISLSPPDGTERWEHLVVGNFRGLGDRDLLLQATNAENYRMGHHLAAFAVDELLDNDSPKPLWTREDFVANAHNGARIADLDGDGKDEVLGGMIVASTGEVLFEIPLRGHIDALFVADVRPDIPGLEVVALEEGGRNELLPFSYAWARDLNRAWDRRFPKRNRVCLFNQDGLIWETHFEHQEPQNAAVGDFDLDRPGLEVWCRSRYNEHQKPFVFDAEGTLIATYQMDDVAPASWTPRGVEVIFTVDWTGEPRQLAAAMERHRSGDVALFDPISGTFLHRFSETADRLYVADVSGDWREELVVLNGNQLHIYQNPEPNPNPDRLSLWSRAHYVRSKMTWNYYSP